MSAYKYKAELIKVLNGDTVRFRVDLGFRLSYTDTFRLAGIDSPELTDGPPGERSRDELKNLLISADDLYVIISKHGKYRWLCKIEALHGQKRIDVNQWLVDQGFAEESKG